MVFFMLSILLVPVPYYVMKPGSAQDVGSMMSIAGEEDIYHRFYLTTISLVKGNIFWYVYANVDRDSELIAEEEVVIKGEDPQEYRVRQEEMMESSQEAAIIAAYTFAEKDVTVDNRGLKILRVVEGMGATRELMPGDVLVAVDGERVNSVEQLGELLDEKKTGDKVDIVYERQRERRKGTITLRPLSEDPSANVGMGIVPVVDREVETKPEVEIAVEEIGGPSAGLLFALQMVDLLSEGDLSKGYKVAGTGTLSTTGEVGQIGGASYKVLAAEQAGAELFFVPRDRTETERNTHDARERVKRDGLDIRVVPVSSLEEAVMYLETLPEKRQAKNLDTSQVLIL
ncbi:PDZ domain-containing protein [Mechercharimyces sp. CAU 1602]|uniref:YlbL family protein n=1 Tax=Mechercharimyces sp. CAU 1602 TaxID=2973933 RepID=UPI0021630A88|nr:PDZ domain-containing protein [Mechercharimyces sp. CAU 1602]MCS1351371.1 PDZ domain-containing protein [Mechercharimyces sp. CAU 1602]